MYKVIFCKVAFRAIAFLLMVSLGMLQPLGIALAENQGSESTQTSTESGNTETTSSTKTDAAEPKSGTAKETKSDDTPAETDKGEIEPEKSKNDLKTESKEPPSLNEEPPNPLPPTLPFLGAQTPKGNKPQVDESSGALSYAYPFEFPKGKNGLTPEVALQYSSQTSEEGSMVGYGWKLNIPSIERLNVHGTDKLYTSKDFVSSISGELTEISPNLFAPKTEQGDFLTYHFQNNSFVAKDKNGVTYSYGLTAAARQDDPNNASKIYQWMLEKVEDSLGNTIEYHYLKIQGEIYPEVITYGGSANGQGIYQIKFQWQNNPWPTVSYKTSFGVYKTKILQKIDVVVNDIVARSYQFSYEQSPNNARSVLKKIGESSGSQTKPGITLNYQTHPLAWTESPAYQVPITVYHPNNEQAREFIDVNGDALPDIVSSEMHYQTNCCWVKTKNVQINNGKGWDAPVSYEIPIPLTVTPAFDDQGKENGARIADVNGDMLADIVQSGGVTPAQGYKIFLKNNGNGWTEKTLNTSNIFSLEGEDRGMRLADLNGDGLPDLLEGSSNGNDPGNNLWSRVYINNGDNFVQDSNWLIPNHTPTLGSSPGTPAQDIGTRLMDINHDGLTDLIRYNIQEGHGAKQYIYLNTGTGFAQDPIFPAAFLPQEFTYNNSCFCYPSDTSTRILDANGDGLQDIVTGMVNSDNNFNVSSTLFLNKGVPSPFQSLSSIFPIGFLDVTKSYDRGGRVADVNGDGIEDLIQSEVAKYSPYVNQHTHLANSTIPDLLSTVTLETGGTMTVKYRASTQYQDANSKLLNPKLPMVIQTVESITETDPFTGLSAETKYVYEGGHYYYQTASDRKFAGFEKVTAVRPDQSKIVTYYHQGNGSNGSFHELKDHVSKIGLPYRKEIVDQAGKLFSRASLAYKVAALPSITNDRFFVYKNQEISEELDGNATSVATAQSSVYDETNGNLLKTTEYGDVSVPAPNAFQDLGNDQRVTQLSYATNQMGQYDISQQVKYGGLNSDTLLGKEKYYYDQLAFGNLEKGFLTKKERWIDEQNIQEEQFSYDATGFVLSSTDPFGKVTTYTPDAYQLYPETVTNALNQTLKYTYNYGVGAVASATDYQNNLTSYSYDMFGRPTGVTFTEVGVNKTYTLETRNYQDTFDLANKKPVSYSVTKYLQETQPNTSKTFFDGLGRTVRTEGENDEGNGCFLTDQSYDFLGNVAKSALPYAGTCGATYEGFSAPENLQTSFSYDVLGRVVAQTNVLGNTSWEYDDRKTTITDPLGKKKMLTTDALGRLTKVTEYVENNPYDTVYNYDLNNHLVAIIDASQNVRKFGYDLLGNRLSATDLHAVNDGSYGMVRESYEKGFRKISTKKAGGQIIEYAYDDLHRLKTKTSGGTILENYTYDTCENGTGKVCKVETFQTTENYSYDVFGRLKSETVATNQKTFTSAYTYDLAGHLLTEKHPNNEVTTLTYTNRGLPKTITHQGTAVIQNTTYNVLGQPETIEYANGKTTTYSYESAKLFQLSNLRTPGLQDTNYSFDVAGNLLTETESSTNHPYSVQYEYDDLYRMTKAAITANQQTTERRYSYDILGNITSSPGGTYLYEGNTSNQEGIKYANPHAATSIGGTPILYTNDGNVKTVGTTNYLYDYNNAIIQVQNNQQTVANYVYLPSGRRIAKYIKAKSNEPNGGAFYSPTKAYEEDGAGSSTIRFFLGNQEVAQKEQPQSGGGTYRYVHPDHLGGTRVITDQQGQEVQTLYYDPFGEIRFNHQAGTFDEQRKFTGHLHDDETELEFMEARYYNAQWGRFLMQDPVFLELGSNPDLLQLLVDPQNLNSYAYARNNPLKYVDPDGRDFLYDAARFFERQEQEWIQMTDVLTFGQFSNAVNVAKNVGPTLRSAYEKGTLNATLVGQEVVNVVSEGVKVAGAALINGMTAGELYLAGKGPSPAPKSNEVKLLNPPIKNIDEKLTSHIIPEHTGLNPTKSAFNKDVNIKAMIQKSTQMPMTKSKGNYVRTFNTGRPIGTDRTTGKQTSWMSVITNAVNNLLSAYPGKAKIHK